MTKSIRWLAVGLVAILFISVLLIDSSAQKRRRKKRPSRPSTPRITNPPIYQPEETNSNSNTSSSEEATSQTETTGDPETMKKTIRDLSSQVDKLSNKIGQMEESQRQLVDLERLSRAEQRSASLWKELRDVEAQQGDLQARAQEIEYALKPENIEQSVAGYGTMRPEELRAYRRRQLESEKLRVQKQQEQLAASRVRLETATVAADAEVERLRKRLDDADQAALENAKTKTQTEGAMPAPTPSPRPR